MAYDKKCKGCGIQYTTKNKKQQFHNSACGKKYMADNKIGFFGLKTNKYE